jgi:hypothetical protein
LPLSKHLQTKNIDLIDADSVRCIIENIRKNAENEFKSIFDEVKTKCDALNIEISLPCKTNVQKNRCNVQENSPEDYFRISLFIPFIDSFIN